MVITFMCAIGQWSDGTIRDGSSGRGVAGGGGLRGLEHPPLSSAIVGGAIQHNIIILYMH